MTTPTRVPRTPVWHVQQFDLSTSVGMDRLMRFQDAFSHAPCAPKSRRETIFLPADASDQLFLVKYGRVVLGQTAPDGKEVLFDVVHPGEIFGERAVLGEEARSTFARALERSMVCAISSAKFSEMVGGSPPLLASLTHVVGTRERRLESRLTDMVFKDAAGRFATLLVRLGDDAGVEEPRGVRLEARLSQEEYGALIGTTRETVSQLFGRFEEAELLAREGRTVWITDRAGLAELGGLEDAAADAPAR